MISINLNGKLINFKSPKIMGILNLTKDSFFDGGKYNSIDSALFRVEEMISQGVDIIDIGGQSTRPGFKIVSSSKELKIVIPILQKIREKFPDIPISIDTFWSEVAEKSLEYQASMINDISSGEIEDSNMFSVIKKHKVPYVLMYSQKSRQTSNFNLDHKNIICNINIFFLKKIKTLYSHGIYDIIIDPGFGFLQDVRENYLVMKHINFFGFKKFPILSGISRKSMIYKIINTTPNNVLCETSALHLVLLLKNVSILRVHDVLHGKKIIQIFEYYKNIV